MKLHILPELMKRVMLLLVLLAAVHAAVDVTFHSLWSASPLHYVTITTNDKWQDIPDAQVYTFLPRPTTVLVSYSVTVFPEIPSLPSTGGLAIIDDTRARGSDDLLAFRVVVDAFPARQSGAFTGYFQTESSLISGYWATPLASGNHSIRLQWKKLGTYVAKWSINPDVGTGFSGGCSLVVAAQHSGIWYSQPLTTIAVTKPLTWEPVMTVSFTLETAMDVRVLYHIPAKPDALPVEGAGYALDEIDTIVEVDGARFRESSAMLLTQAKFSQPGLLMGDITLPLASGKHVVTVMWRLTSPTGRKWRSIPSFNDGFMMGRLLAVMGETVNDIVQVSRDPTIYSGVPSSLWFNVGSPHRFHLASASNVLVHYFLPVQFLRHPTFLSFNQLDVGDVAARLLVDNQPYRATGSTVSGASRGAQTAEGSMVLHLQSGTHVIRLQWQYQQGLDAQDVMTILNHISKNDQIVELTVQIDSWIDNPEIVARSTALTGVENHPIPITPPVFIQDASPDSVVEINYAVVVSFVAAKGILDVRRPSEGVSFMSPSIMQGRLSDINAALATLKYIPPSMWYGSDTITLRVNDAKQYEIEPVFAGSTVIGVTITHDPVPPTLVVPLTQSSVAEGGSVVVQGLKIQGDFMSATDVGMIPQVVSVSLQVSGGLLNLRSIPRATVVFTIGSGAGDARMAFYGNVTDVNEALATIEYIPDADFNSLQHVESLEVVAMDDKSQLTTSASIPIQVLDRNDPSTVDTVNPTIVLRGYTLQFAPIGGQVFVRLQVHSPLGRLSLSSPSNAMFTIGSRTAQSRVLMFHGLAIDVQQTLQSMAYSRLNAFYGNELISVECSSSATFDVSELSFIQLQLSKVEGDGRRGNLARSYHERMEQPNTLDH
ncbi:hypothetical protein H310_07160 [Aphanomyces invadans]|uniref:Cadherin domain-containing protein n=1 Tax=Aphanomyces invadans TaxID=157072 RepID=A0A024U2Y0_9STRA|nr:hypothetical protein H310_07160 [Aphanomyces invadans]ETW00580.1 hypothetical protein H310_07160 [Aphanomyces invadans]|eukprot:XP_008870715.1 hypothetical protein H310_07160 [Aphanomyces invadans]